MTEIPDLDDVRRDALRTAVPGLTPIGYARSRYPSPADTPIQTSRNRDEEALITVFPEFAAGLDGLAGFDYAWVLAWLDQGGTKPADLRVVPFLLRDRGEQTGLFSTRYPERPNPIGLSLIRILAIDGPLVRFAGVDLSHGTPVLDIKPWVPDFDLPPAPYEARRGWYDTVSESARSQTLPEPGAGG